MAGLEREDGAGGGALMSAIRERLRSRGSVMVRTPQDVLAGAGRVVLWLAVGLVLLRGAEATLGLDDNARPALAPRAVATAEWPDDAARALAVEFATAYLTHTPGEDPAAAGQRLGAPAAFGLGGVAGA